MQTMYDALSFRDTQMGALRGPTKFHLASRLYLLISEPLMNLVPRGIWILPARRMWGSLDEMGADMSGTFKLEATQRKEMLLL
jgi:hypothetical protein